MPQRFRLAAAQLPLTLSRIDIPAPQITTVSYIRSAPFDNRMF